MKTKYCGECKELTEFYTYIDLGNSVLKCRECDKEFDPKEEVKLKKVEKEIEEVQEEIK